MMIEFLLILILVALVYLDVRLEKIATLLQEDRWERKHREDEDDYEELPSANDYMIKALEPASPEPDLPSETPAKRDTPRTRWR
jgi:hypothetical protein